MTAPIPELLALARAARTAGRFEEARAGYGEAAATARRAGDRSLLAHALRHISDMDREAGLATEALASAEEAEAIYRADALTPPLDLANVARLVAFASERLGRTEAASARWGEALQLYQRAGVEDGVLECRQHLQDLVQKPTPQ